MNTEEGTAEYILKYVTDEGIVAENKLSEYLGLSDFKLYYPLEIYWKLLLSITEEISFILSNIVDYTISTLATTISSSLKIGGTAANASVIGAFIGLPMNILGLFVHLIIYVGSFIGFCLAFVIYYYIIRFFIIPYLYGLLGLIVFKILFFILLLISPYIMSFILVLLKEIKILIAKILRKTTTGLLFMNSLVWILSYILIVIVMIALFFNIFTGLMYADEIGDQDGEGDGEEQE
tara:strand:+ start:669 stop:1373 length:705 start_codon:yes stop_codon:yes gene_type:complete